MEKGIARRHWIALRAQRFMNPALAIGVAAGFGLIVLVLAFPDVFASLLARVTPGIIWYVPTQRHIISLTVDDGPDPVYTPKLLALLKAGSVRATFFVVGERVRQYPEIVAEICRNGHEIANHGDTWRRAIGMSVAAFDKDISRAQSTIDAFDCSTRYFRPAGVWLRPSQLRSLQQRGHMCVLGTAYGFDAHRPPATYIAWVINRALRPGSIVVVHDSGGDRSPTLEAVPKILEAANRKGLTFVPLSTLIAEMKQ